MELAFTRIIFWSRVNKAEKKNKADTNNDLSQSSLIQNVVKLYFAPI